MGNNNNEIDLFEVFHLIQRFFNWLGKKIFGILKFFIQNVLLIIGTLIIGFVIGWGIDYIKGQTYQNQIIVIPNFDSVDYLYSKVENFDNQENIKTNATLKKISKVEIKPIFDLFAITQNSGERTQEILNTLIDNGSSIENLKDDKTIFKKNKYHLIDLYTKDASSSSKVVDEFMVFLNSNEFFKNKTQQEIRNLQLRKKNYIASLGQIDSIIKVVNHNNSFNIKSDLSINSYGDLNSLVELKGSTTEKIAEIEIILLELEKPIYDVQRNINIKHNDFSNSFKYILPIIFLVLLALWGMYIFLAKRYQ